MVGVDLGAAAVGDFLVYALGVGDQPCSAATGHDFLARAHNGRRKWADAMAEVRIALGRCRVDQYFPIAFLPVSGIWVWYTGPNLANVRSAEWFSPRPFSCICVAPWLVRNYRTFGQFVFIRSNFGAEVRLGNGPGADGTWMDYLHPTKNASEIAAMSNSVNLHMWPNVNEKR